MVASLLRSVRIAFAFCVAPSFVAASLVANSAMATAQDGVVSGVARQPLEASVKRLREALRFLGEPLEESLERSLLDIEKETEIGRAHV